MLPWRDGAQSCGKPRALVATAGAALLLLTAGAGGCAGRHWDYDKRGITAIKLDHDLRECRREAYRPHTLAIFHRVDDDALNHCMERRGYRVTPLD